MFKVITDPKRAGVLFSLALLMAYAILPLGIYYLLGNPYAMTLVQITLIGTLGFSIGWFIRIESRMYLLSIRAETLIVAIWVPFILFVLLAFVSAEKIPMIAALQGASVEQIADYREKFLKSRQGWQASFVYINALLTGALIPYSMALLFYFKSKIRWHLLLFFILYCISFNEKAFFLRAIIPLIFLTGQQKIKLPLRSSHILALSLGLLLLVTMASGWGVTREVANSEFLSGHYASSGAVSFLFWRAVAIPVVTAVDSIRIFFTDFGGRFFHGGTSTLLSGVFGLHHVDFERAVFAGQFGQTDTGTGSSNSVFLVEAFVNWGYWGVALVSILMGAFFRFICSSRDPCLQAIWLLLAFSLFSAGFLGTLFSNGYLVLFFIVFFIRVRVPTLAARPPQGIT